MEEKPIEFMRLHDHYELRVWVAAFEHACSKPDLYHDSDERADIAVRQLRNRREREYRAAMSDLAVSIQAMLDRGFLRPLHADIPPDFALLPNGKIEPITDRGREIDAAIAVRRSASCGGALSDAKS